MEQGQQKPKGLQGIIRFSMLVIIILQLVIIVFIIGISGTKKQLDSNAEKILGNTVSFRAINLEEMLLKWSTFPDTIRKMETTITDLENSYNIQGKELIKDKKIRTEILKNSSDILLKMIRSTEATGAFVILDEGTEENKKEALYLRDLNPESTPTNNVDILVEAGGGESILTKGFTLDTEWSMELPLYENRDFFDKPMEAVKQFPGLKTSEYGYFSTGFRLRENDIKIMTYTVPLIDGQGHAYGVLGIEINLDYLKKFLPNKEIGIDEDAAFLLGTLNENSSVKSVLVEGNHFQARIADDEVTLKEIDSNFYKADFINKESKVIAFVSKMQLYDRNTPFEKEQWILTGLVHSDALYQSSNKLVIAFFVAIVMALIVSIIGAVAVSTIILKPIKLLMESLKLKKGKNVRLPKTQIMEIDELAREIERLNEASFKEGARVADILEISNLPLGVFEFEEGAESFFCTKQVFTILGISMEVWKNNHVNTADFEREFEKIKKNMHVEDKEDGVCRLVKGEEEIYIRYRSSKEGKRSIHIIMDVTEEVREKQVISHDRDYDILTNLYNRRAFSREIDALMDSRNCSKAILAVWDLDNLKYINDAYGHDMGDKYICLLADSFVECNKDCLLVGRISGDEFMIFAYADNRDENYERIRKIHESVQSKKLYLPDGGETFVSASVGTVEYATDGIIYEEMVKYADFAMYEAKKNGKGMICAFSKDTYIKNYILICGVGELNRILKEEDVRYAFQPIFDIKTKKIFAYEALMRPNSDVLMSPDELLKVASLQSKLKQIEQLTWRHALKEFTSKCKDKRTKLFINSLPDQCLSEEDISSLENQYKEWMDRIVIEVTEESQSNKEYEQIKRECKRRWNAQMALDDYGSGYSNADFLTSVEWEYVKLDRALIQNIHQSNSRQKLLEGIIAYCHENNVKIIAEGVETTEEFMEIKRLGCDCVQGYYFAKPGFDLIEVTPEMEQKLSEE